MKIINFFALKAVVGVMFLEFTGIYQRCVQYTTTPLSDVIVNIFVFT